MATSSTRTLAARVPDGWWMGHARYRRYVMFAGTGMVLALVNCLLLVGLSALGSGFAGWESYQGFLGSPPGLLLVVLLLGGTVFFSLRWLRVGAKIPSVRLGVIPAPSTGMVLIAHYAGLVTITLVVLAVLSGVVV